MQPSSPVEKIQLNYSVRIGWDFVAIRNVKVFPQNKLHKGNCFAEYFIENAFFISFDVFMK